jgi:hypothetical protein
MERTSALGPPQEAGGASRGGPTEKVFMGQVIDYARLMGWVVYHPWISVRSEPGFPDVLAVRAGRLVVAELKSLTGKLSPAQEGWLGALGAVPGCEVRVWRPDDESWADIERTLR